MLDKMTLYKLYITLWDPTSLTLYFDINKVFKNITKATLVIEIILIQLFIKKSVLRCKVQVNLQFFDKKHCPHIKKPEKRINIW